ncbi:MAG: transporter related [Acidimicrobiales bacterium]|nr:transporter related [Acidimicrobiales bacterium]
MSALLELDGVSAGYGPFRALFDVSLTVPDGTAVALLGSNGSGKSTVARVATGLVPVSRGRIRFDGRDVTGWPAWRLARLGVAHAPEGRSVFASLTVEENLLLTFRAALGRGGVPDALARAYAAFPRLGERRKQSAGTLSGGEQRMLSLAKVLANPPRLLVVDELSLGLAPVVVDEVFRTLQLVRDNGTALLVVDQHVGRALALADHVVLLSKGQVVHHGPAGELGDLAEKLMPGAPV